MKQFLKEYRVEIASAIVTLIGIFLVVDFTVRDRALSILAWLGQGVWHLLKRILAVIDNRISLLSPSDALGGLLILLALGFVVWRVRHRFRTGRRWGIDYCPKCSGPIRRMHRNYWDHILGATLYPHARRYRCIDPDCGWSGLLRRHVHIHHDRVEPVSEVENPLT